MMAQGCLPDCYTKGCKNEPDDVDETKQMLEKVILAHPEKQAIIDGNELLFSV